MAAGTCDQWGEVAASCREPEREAAAPAPGTGVVDTGSGSAGTRELRTGLGQPADRPPGVEASGATGSDSAGYTRRGHWPHPLVKGPRELQRVGLAVRGRCQGAGGPGH